MRSDTYEAGKRNRTAVLGEQYVQRASRDPSDFTAPLNDLIMEYCWGAVWDRPGLEFKTRSMLNIAMLTALNRTEELALHVRGALTNGCTVNEIQEIVLQAAIYCGVPAALDASRTVQRVLREHGQLESTG